MPVLLSGWPPLFLYRILPLLLGFTLDAMIGDPPGWPHPVRFFGKMVDAAEPVLRRWAGTDARRLQMAGGLLAVGVTAIAFCASHFLLELAGLIHPLLRMALATLFCYQCIAAKDLFNQSMRVHAYLQKDSLHSARLSLSMIVGRDTADLDTAAVAKAAVETVAENTSDGVIAPLFYLFLGGPALGLWYKAVNTLDSMVGYRSPLYIDFGKASARLDDIVNFIPARLSALLMLWAAPLARVGANVADGFRVYKRDKQNHLSPNSAHTEAACAGLLGIRLGGPSQYGGTMVDKPTIGDPLRPVSPDDIPKANRLMFAASLLALFCFAALLALVALLFAFLKIPV